MSWLEAIFLGIVQGITEFLPVSSSGHLVLFQSIFDPNANPEDAKEIFFDGVLVPAVNLVNGRTIVRELTTDVVEYFHIEVEGQAIVYADGAPAETYVNHDNRKMFANWPEYVSLYGEDESRKDVGGAFERGYPCVTSGPVLETIRAELDERSQPESALAA